MKKKEVISEIFYSFRAHRKPQRLLHALSHTHKEGLDDSMATLMYVGETGLFTRGVIEEIFVRYSGVQ